MQEVAFDIKDNNSNRVPDVLFISAEGLRCTYGDPPPASVIVLESGYSVLVYIQ